MGIYEFSINGLIQSYILAIPFFKYTLLSTLMFSLIIECIIKLLKIKKLSYSTFIILNENLFR